MKRRKSKWKINSTKTRIRDEISCLGFWCIWEQFKTHALTHIHTHTNKYTKAVLFVWLANFLFQSFKMFIPTPSLITSLRRFELNGNISKKKARNNYNYNCSCNLKIYEHCNDFMAKFVHTFYREFCHWYWYSDDAQQLHLYYNSSLLCRNGFSLN